MTTPSEWGVSIGYPGGKHRITIGSVPHEFEIPPNVQSFQLYSTQVGEIGSVWKHVMRIRFADGSTREVPMVPVEPTEQERALIASTSPTERVYIVEEGDGNPFLDNWYTLHVCRTCEIADQIVERLRSEHPSSEYRVTELVLSSRPEKIEPAPGSAYTPVTGLTLTDEAGNVQEFGPGMLTVERIKPDLRAENERLRKLVARLVSYGGGKWEINIREGVDLGKYIGNLMTPFEWDQLRIALDAEDAGDG